MTEREASGCGAGTLRRSEPIRGADVALVRWPAEADRLEGLRATGRPRLLVVEEGSPPATDDWLEDWLRTPVDADEARIRLETLRSRARHRAEDIDLADGALQVGEHLVVLPPIQASLAAALLERRGAVVSREALLRRGWPDEKPKDRNVLDVHLARLRRLLAGTGIEIRTVHRRGYLLETGDVSDRGAGTLRRSEPTHGDV
jgi:DNA-binding winged helix-turn-helix (wHTH) protein